MPNVLESLASGIVQYEFDSDTEIATVANVSGWLFDLYTEFTGADADLDIEAQNVAKELYLCSYYNKQARNALRGIVNSSTSGDNVLSLRDGESAVTFVNRNEVSKVYKGLADDCMENVVRLAGQYNIYGAQPRQAVGVDGSGVYGTRYNYYPTRY